MEPEDLAGYSLRRRLGSGSAGTLWQVRDLATGRHAVLRRIPVTTIQREEQFRDELMVLQRINHPHIARVLEVRETATEWLVFSQHVVALSLTEVLRRRGAMSPGEIVTLLSPLADALHYLHHCGLIHGHLTPPNILIDVEGRPLLTDATFHSLNLHAPTSPPPSHGADLLALSTIAAHAGGPATLFEPAVFTKTPAPRLASHLLTLTTPEPINLGDPDDPPPDPPTTTTDDDPIEHSRTPLAPPSPKPSAPTSPQPTTPEPPTANPVPTHPKPRRALLPKLTRRTADSTPNPLSRLTSKPLTRTHVVHPTQTHLIGTTHVEPAISWSARPAERRPPNATPFTIPERPPSWSSPSAPIAEERTPAATPSAVPERPPTTRSAPPVPATERRALNATPFGVPLPSPSSSKVDSEQSSDGFVHGPALTRGLTRRRVWRRRHTWWGRLDLSRPLTELRYRLSHLAYGVAAAVGLGVAVVLGLGLAARTVLGESDTPTATAAETSNPAPASASGQPSAARTTPTASVTAPASSRTQAGSTSPTPPARTAPTPPGNTNPTTPSPPRRSTTSRSVADWLTTLHALDAQRAQAFRTLDTATLDKIYIPGSPPWRSDRALLADYRKQHIHIQGLRIQIDKTTITHQTPTMVTLRTTDHLTAGQAVHKSGTRIPLPPGTPTTRLITLTRTTSKTTPTWRITKITPP